MNVLEEEWKRPEALTRAERIIISNQQLIMLALACILDGDQSLTMRRKLFDRVTKIDSLKD